MIKPYKPYHRKSNCPDQPLDYRVGEVRSHILDYGTVPSHVYCLLVLRLLFNILVSGIYARSWICICVDLPCIASSKQMDNMHGMALYHSLFSYHSLQSWLIVYDKQITSHVQSIAIQTPWQIPITQQGMRAHA